jgi:hypothetical protein
VVARLEVSTKREAIADWLNRQVPILDAKTPLETLAGGGYERLARRAPLRPCAPKMPVSGRRGRRSPRLTRPA